MTWARATVISHVQHHENYNAKGDNPPWTRVARCDDGREVSFDWGTVYRDGTHEHNTRVGMTVWVSDKGGVSARQKDGASE